MVQISEASGLCERVFASKTNINGWDQKTDWVRQKSVHPSVSIADAEDCKPVTIGGQQACDYGIKVASLTGEIPWVI